MWKRAGRIRTVSRNATKGSGARHVTFLAVLNACASIAALEEGRRIRDQIVQSNCESDLFVGSSLIDMYAKCRSREDARRVFNKMTAHNNISWNAMLAGYAIHGHPKEALGHFVQMCREGVGLDMVTFVSLLSACSHVGLVDEGLHYFESIGLVCGTSATVEHYTCMVDLLGCAGYLQNAEDLIETLSCRPNSSGWMAFLSVCRVHGNTEMGEGICKPGS
jgi:pentatricopeptide repeat protein